MLLGQCIGQLLGTVLNAGFKHGFIFTEGSNIGESGNEPAAFDRIAAHLNDAAIFTNPFKFMGTADLHPVNPFPYMFFNRARATFTTFSVITDQVCDWTTDIDNIGRIIEQFQILIVPGYQAHIFINYADPLGHVINHGHDQVLIKALPLRGLIENIGDLTQCQTIINHSCGQQGTCRGCPDSPRQILFGETPPHAIGTAVFIQLNTVLGAELLESACGWAFAGNAFSQGNQITDF